MIVCPICGSVPDGDPRDYLDTAADLCCRCGRSMFNKGGVVFWTTHTTYVSARSAGSVGMAYSVGPFARSPVPHEEAWALVCATAVIDS